MDKMIDVNKNTYMGGPIMLNKIQLLDAEKVWEKYWVSNKLKSNVLIRLLDTVDLKFSDFLIVYLYKEILFSRINRKNTKSVIEDLKMMITITKKEEDEIISAGFKNTKNTKKIYKRLLKAYSTPVNKKRGCVVTGSMYSDLTGKDILIMALDEMFRVNADPEEMIEELDKAMKDSSAPIFLFNYLVSIYMGYTQILDMIEVSGEYISGEFKASVENALLGELSLYFKHVTKEDTDVERLFNDYVMDTASDIVENEAMIMQNDKAIYAQKYIGVLKENVELKETINELQEEVNFYKEYFKNKLSNKKVLLIGDKKKEKEYVGIVEAFGGKMDMMDSFEDFSKISSSVLDGYNYIVLFTYYTSHSVSDKLNKYSNKVKYVNSSSKIELEKVLIYL